MLTCANTSSQSCNIASSQQQFSDPTRRERERGRGGEKRTNELDMPTLEATVSVAIFCVLNVAVIHIWLHHRRPAFLDIAAAHDAGSVAGDARQVVVVVVEVVAETGRTDLWAVTATYVTLPRSRVSSSKRARYVCTWSCCMQSRLPEVFVSGEGNNFIRRGLCYLKFFSPAL